ASRSWTDHHWWPRRPSSTAGERGADSFPRGVRIGAGRVDAGGRAHPGAGWIGCEAGWHPRLSFRCACGRGSSCKTTQDLRHAGRGRAGPHALQRAERHARRVLPQRCAQLLEDALSAEIERRVHPDHDRSLRGVPSAHSADHHRALSWAAPPVKPPHPACPLRDEGFNMAIISEWTDPQDTERCIAWARDTYDAMRPFMGTTRYLNYLDNDEAGDPALQVYGPNYARLRELKTKYDPENFFRNNLNIRPLGAAWRIPDVGGTMLRDVRFLIAVTSVVFVAGILLGHLFQPWSDVHAESAKRVFEIRTYTAQAGKLDALNARFRDHTIPIFEKHGMK